MYVRGKPSVDWGGWFIYLFIWALPFTLLGAGVGYVRGKMLGSAHKWEMSAEDWAKPTRELIWEAVVTYAIIGLVLGVIGGLLASKFGRKQKYDRG